MIRKFIGRTARALLRSLRVRLIRSAARPSKSAGYSSGGVWEHHLEIDLPMAAPLPVGDGGAARGEPGVRCSLKCQRTAKAAGLRRFRLTAIQCNPEWRC